ncbi:iron-siderophore ABC transporter substrate-binding protein [Priestia megaterium]|uniref:ABC transporter substrate-binding protein n=1 Tax=Priestia megaterium TaxID=1404 RepID=UPI0031768DC7
MRTYSKSVIALVMVFVLCLLSACGNNQASTKETSKSNATVTIKHAMGETKVPQKPKRIVVLTNEGTEALLSMGIKPVGAVQSWLGNPWYDHIKDKMKGVQNVGTEMEPSLEKIAALKPDLIIGNKVRQEKTYDQLNAIAPTVFADQLSGDWKKNLMLYAKAVNKEDKGKQVIQDFDKHVETVKKQLGDQVNKKVSIVRFTGSDARIYHKDSFSGVILDQLGFARPKSQDVNDLAELNVTKERIPAMDGDVLFYFSYETGDGKATTMEKEWVNDPLFKKLNVSKEGNVHKVSEAIWNTAGGVIAANKMLDDINKIMVNK